MTESFLERGLAGARFERVDLTGATFEQVYLAGARFHQVDLSRVQIRSAYVKDVVIDGEVENLTVNGIDVVPLIEAELDRRHPERVKLRPTDAEGFRDAWPVIEMLWDDTVQRARALDPSLLHQRVDGEWSFIETLRHLLFATDAWIGRVMLGNPSPWHPLDLPWDELPDTEGIPRDRDARPSLQEVLALRNDRMSKVAQVIGALTDEQLAGSTAPVPDPGWPRSKSYPVREVLMTIINEEWWHRQFAERDLATLTQP
ncbi:MAG TPA: DinB family protein [Acidimicrobiia bacterium]|nr:DinB family protein [Acidimicrobiia bacterium]